MFKFLTRTRGKNRLDWTDYLSYGYLVMGLFIMFGPVLWLILSSFKTQSGISEFPPSLLPYTQKQVSLKLEGDTEAQKYLLYTAKLPNGETKIMAEVRRVGIMSTLIDADLAVKTPAAETVQVNINDRVPVREVYWATENYSELFGKFNFLLYFGNSVFITVIATLLTLLFNSMAAFALSKYQFRGQKVVFVLILSTLMVPPAIIMVPAFLVISEIGLLNNLWGVIWPAIATPTGVFLLRQYMLTIPDELIEAARMDYASEWRIYWRIVLPLTAPALAVLAIFSVMWRWNDFLWPLIVLSKSEFFTLQLALNSFQGELSTEWHYVLAMTVITLLPVTLIFAFLQKYITTGIASAGVK